MDFFKLSIMKGGSNLSNAVYSLVQAAIDDVSFILRLKIIHAVVVRVGHWARWCEGCWCHDHLLVEAASFDQRKRALMNAGVPKGVCPWQGKRGTELALGKKNELLADINAAGGDVL
jgi:hypothetical protein